MEHVTELYLVGDGLKKAKAQKSPTRTVSTSPSRKAKKKENHSSPSVSPKNPFKGMSKSDKIDKACKERKAAGNILMVVDNAETHMPIPRTFNLHLKYNYDLIENPMNKMMVKIREKEMASSPRRTKKSKSPARVNYKRVQYN